MKKIYGFTLVELIIVITIITVLATISVLSFSQYTKQSQNVILLSNVEIIHKSIDTYNIKVGKILPVSQEINS
jgi:prepilin-type N-terminal cleavage/methylation domain-containing protein